MSSVPVVRDIATHVARAEVHRQAGDRLLAVDDEWFAVCYFYSAYHLVKAAMAADPVFGSISALQTISPSLTLDAQFAEHHSGGFGKNGRSLGVNEVVFHLYKGIRVSYVRLHMASCHVRYGRGLETLSPTTSIDDYNDVMNSYQGGLLTAPSAP